MGRDNISSVLYVPVYRVLKSSYARKPENVIDSWKFWHAYYLFICILYIVIL
jgi:hypothetical protein